MNQGRGIGSSSGPCASPGLNPTDGVADRLARLFRYR